MALELNYFWTWDHRCNWVLDDPGLQLTGCFNPYLKRPETFVEDYRRLTDVCAEGGIPGIVIYGFLRDSHGGMDAAREVVRYAADRGVRILPNLGTTAFGGAYYEGEHEFNLDTFLLRHPDCVQIEKDGKPSEQKWLCPTHPEVIRWMKDGARWLMETFEVGGVNVENGDLMSCHCPRCIKRREGLEPGELDYFKTQLDGYGPCLEALGPYMADRWITYATYSGFAQYEGEVPEGLGFRKGRTPAFVAEFPGEAVAQWTLTKMLLQQPLPLTAYLEDGAPEAVYENPNWPRGLKVPGERAVGYVHQGSHFGLTRHSLVVSSIKEACLRGAEAGLKGISIYGEVTDRCTPWWLSYQAYFHFVRRPQDSLRQFANARLAPVLGGEDAAQLFIEVLAHWTAGEVAEPLRKALFDEFFKRDVERDGLEAFNLWYWLFRQVCEPPESAKCGFF